MNDMSIVSYLNSLSDSPGLTANTFESMQTTFYLKQSSGMFCYISAQLGQIKFHNGTKCNLWLKVVFAGAAVASGLHFLAAAGINLHS